jgi:hypothetical protein
LILKGERVVDNVVMIVHISSIYAFLVSLFAVLVDVGTVSASRHIRLSGEIPRCIWRHMVGCIRRRFFYILGSDASLGVWKYLFF